MRLAIDLDNTIVAYDDLFIAAARERNLVAADFCGAKTLLRNVLRSRPGGELDWQSLQADVYGTYIERAAAFPGSREFIVRAREIGARVAIVSHKTAFAAARPKGPNLHTAARAWLTANSFLGSGLVAETDLYFEVSREAKLARICALGTNIAIDDLAEVLTDPGFPPDARRWLFAPRLPLHNPPGLESFNSWADMRRELEGAFLR